MVLPIIFYYSIITKNIALEGINSIYIIYTGIVYIVSFAVLVTFILKKNLIGFRTIFIINLFVSLPVSAYIGVLVAIVSMMLSFTGKVTTYFEE